MLLDLRVVLSACLATLLFLIVGFSLAVSYRPPFKAPVGPTFAGPGLPSGRPLPVTMPAPVPATAHQPARDAEPVLEARPAFEIIQTLPTVAAKSAIEAKATIADLIARDNQPEVTGSIGKEQPMSTPSAPVPIVPVSAVADVPAAAPPRASAPALPPPAPPPSAVMPAVAPLPTPQPSLAAIGPHNKKAAHRRGRRQHQTTLTPADTAAHPALPASAHPAVPVKKKRHRARRAKQQTPPPSNNPFASFMNKNTKKPAAAAR